MRTPEEFARSALDDGRETTREHLPDEIAFLAELIRARDAEVAEQARVQAYRDLWTHCYDDGDAAAIVGGFAFVTRELGIRAGHGGPDLDRYCEEMVRRDAERLEADLARLTRERDEALRCAEIDRLQINRLTRERDKAERQHKALRADVERQRRPEEKTEQETRKP